VRDEKIGGVRPKLKQGRGMFQDEVDLLKILKIECEHHHRHQFQNEVGVTEEVDQVGLRTPCTIRERNVFTEEDDECGIKTP
jgi:hypothetical protein